MWERKLNSTPFYTYQLMEEVKVILPPDRLAQEKQTLVLTEGTVVAALIAGLDPSERRKISYPRTESICSKFIFVVRPAAKSLHTELSRIQHT